MDEKQLLQYYKETGSLDALGKLYAPYMSLLYGVCYKYLQDAEQSQDAVMQIFDELINKLRVYEVDNFKSWVYVYARNFCLMQLRKNKQITKVDIEENLYESEKMLNDDDEKKWGEQDFEKLESCIAGLNQEQELCIRMFYLEQKCYKDIADQTGYRSEEHTSELQSRENLVCRL